MVDFLKRLGRWLVTHKEILLTIAVVILLVSGLCIGFFHGKNPKSGKEGSDGETGQGKENPIVEIYPEEDGLQIGTSSDGNTVDEVTAPEDFSDDSNVSSDVTEQIPSDNSQQTGNTDTSLEQGNTDGQDSTENSPSENENNKKNDDTDKDMDDESVLRDDKVWSAPR